MKKILFFSLFIALAVIFVGCNQEEGGQGADTTQNEQPALPMAQTNENNPTGQEPLKVVATIFPQYDFVRQIAGDIVELTMLISPGAESHGFEPTPRDMVALNNADLLIYTGGHGDDWVDSFLAALERQDMRTVALVDLVGHVHSHDHSHHHGHSHHHHHDDDECEIDHHHDHSHSHHDHHHDIDEHVWTCPRNAIQIVHALTDVLSEMNPQNSSLFHENAASLIRRLQDLDNAFVEVVAHGTTNTVIFGDRFPFHYFVTTYGLHSHAAFEGCSAETQASPATIASLINIVESQNIPVVFYIEFSNRSIANVIAEATGARLLEFHSAHNVSHADFNAGVTYLDIMWQNVEALREALAGGSCCTP